MSTLALLSVIVVAAAIFGWLSVRVLRLPITIGTMLLTGTCSVIMMASSRFVPALDTWADSLVTRIRFEDLILHGMRANRARPARAVAPGLAPQGGYGKGREGGQVAQTVCTHCGTATNRSSTRP